MNLWHFKTHRLNGSLFTGSGSRLKRSDTRFREGRHVQNPTELIMKLIHFIIFIMVSFFVMLTWVLILNNLDDDIVLAVRTGGHVIDLQADYDAHKDKDAQDLKSLPAQLFRIRGFEFYSRLQDIKAHDKVLRRASKVWALHGKGNTTGTIEISDLQRFNVRPTKRWKKETEPLEDADVVVQIKYYISSDVTTTLNVIGVNTKEGEQTMEMLESVVDPSMLCTKLVYVGPVDIVIIEGFAKNPNDFVVVDELKLAVGVKHADVFGEDAEEMTCVNR